MKNINVRLSCLVQSGMSKHSQGKKSIPFIVHNTGNGSTRNRYYERLGTTPHVSTICLSRSTGLHISQVTRSPRLSSAVFHTGGDEY